MRILVIGGMHGNEPLGLEVVQLFKRLPVNGVDVLLANKRAIEKQCRFIKYDLNRSFPGNSATSSYEQRRAAQILALTKNYDLVLDFHNTHCPENDCGFVGDTANKQLHDVAWVLGLKRIVVAGYDCINKYARNCLSIEVSLDSCLNHPELWYERVACLSRLESVQTKSRIERYCFVYRMTLEDNKRLHLDKRNLRAFQPMQLKLAQSLGVKSPAFPIFVGDGFTPYNYGGILNNIT